MLHFAGNMAHMKKKRKVPAGARNRVCPECGQGFRAMTDLLWRHIYSQHATLSERHKKVLARTRPP